MSSLQIEIVLPKAVCNDSIFEPVRERTEFVALTNLILEMRVPN